MPRAFEMSWDAVQERWTKMYRGKRFTIACSVLGVPPTKEGSYQAANEWWRNKRAEIDGVTSADHPHAEMLADLQKKLAYAHQHGLQDEAASLTSQIGEVQNLPPDQEPITQEMTRRLEVLSLFGGQVPLDLDPIVLAEVFGDSRIWADRFAREPQAPANQSIEAHADLWQRQQQALVAAGQMSPDRAGNNRTCLAYFKGFVGASKDVKAINADVVRNFYLDCVSKVAKRRTDPSEGWSTAYAKDVFSVTKGFVRWLWEQGTIDLPKNIGSKSFKFGGTSKTIKTWTPEEFQKVVKEAPGKLKLGLLLMANCGMTQIDVSDLIDGEVNWKEGRITRKRSKTEDHEEVPTVCYKLWPTTFALLKKYRSGTDRVLLTESGLPYLRKELKDGKTSKADGFASNYVHLKRRLKLHRTLKQLRKLGSTLLDDHKEYGRFGSYFLGHSPRTVKDKHYAAPSQTLFDEAVAWLGRQLGQCDGGND